MFKIKWKFYFYYPMKKIWFWILLCISIFFGAFSTFSHNTISLLNNIFEIQHYVEETLNISSLSSTGENHFPLIKEILEKKCPTESITESKKTLQNILPYREISLQTNSEFILQDTFSQIRDITLQIHSDDPAEFCKNKYLGYSFLEVLYLHINHELFKNKTPLSSTAPISRQKIKIHNKTELLSGESLELANTTDEIIDSEFQNLLRLNILTTGDLTILDEGIEVNYFSWCEKTHGSFHFLKNKTTQEKKFKILKLKIGICPSASNQTNYKNHIKQLLAHELGHYIYFFKDQTTDEFDTLCRKNGKNICKNQDFYSVYAKNNKEEDYAESFAYRYKDLNEEKEFWSAPASEILAQKESYFHNLFSQK